MDMARMWSKKLTNQTDDGEAPENASEPEGTVTAEAAPSAEHAAPPENDSNRNTASAGAEQEYDDRDDDQSSSSTSSTSSESDSDEEDGEKEAKRSPDEEKD